MSEPTPATRAEVCAVACAEAFRGDGEILASPFGSVPMVGIRLAKLTFSPELCMTDGIASLVANVLPIGVTGEGDLVPIYEGWMPFRSVFDTLWNGKRHVMMGATQIDRFGNQNFASVGPYAKPTAQFLGMRGAPGNTLSHKTSYWIANHTDRVFVKKVDVVSGVGYDRAAKLHPASRRFHCIHRVVTNLAVLDFETPDHSMRLRSTHPGVSVDDVVKATGFDLVIPSDVDTTRLPTPSELRLIREVIDPKGLAAKEVSG